MKDFAAGSEQCLITKATKVQKQMRLVSTGDRWQLIGNEM